MKNNIISLNIIKIFVLMISYRSYIFIHILFIIIYVIQLFSDFLLIGDVLKINKQVRAYYIINFIYDILLLIFLVIRLILAIDSKEKFNIEYFEEYDYWFFILGSSMYYVGVIYYYAYQISYQDKIDLNESNNFKIYFLIHLPVALIYISIIGLVLIMCVFFIIILIIYGCFITDNKIEPV